MKEKLYFMAKYLIFITAITQLAISQLHIGVITRVFDPAIGFYLFLFTIFGVLMAFNSSSYKTGQKTLIFVGGAVAAVLTGIKFVSIIFIDIAAGQLLTFEDAQKSITVAIVTIVIYAISTPIMIITGFLNEK